MNFLQKLLSSALVIVFVLSTPANLLSKENLDIAWKFQESWKNEIPQTTVYLLVNGAKHAVLTKAPMRFNVIENQDYAKLQIPSTAIKACSGWWAGSGSVLYVLKKGGFLEIYEQRIDSEVGKGSWKKIKKIKSKTQPTITQKKAIH